jgi:alanine racemase
MDAVTADVTDLPAVDGGDEFVLLGAQGPERIGAGELARRRNTIAREVLAAMAPRLTRVYHPVAETPGIGNDASGG